MDIREDIKRIREADLDACNQALEDKPYLAKVYDTEWRVVFRAQTINAEHPGYPIPYIAGAWARDNDPYLRPQLQVMIEHGLSIVWEQVDDATRNELIARLRDNDSNSVTEELCLAAGCAEEFGSRSIIVPKIIRGSRKPEFELHTDMINLAVETRRLDDSQSVRAQTRATIESGHNCWIMAADSQHDVTRLQRAIAKKLCRPQSALPTILIITQFSAWPTPAEGLRLVADIAMQPTLYDIKATPALGIAYTHQRVIHGIWFHTPSLIQHRITDDARDCIRQAICRAYYPRFDGVLFTEQPS